MRKLGLRRGSTPWIIHHIGGLADVIERMRLKLTGYGSCQQL
jgi:hypothetical protein